MKLPRPGWSLFALLFLALPAAAGEFPVVVDETVLDNGLEGVLPLLSLDRAAVPQ